MKTTTAVAIAPLKAVPVLIVEAQSIKITTQEHMLEAAEVLSRLNKVSDALTGEKEKLTKPLNATLKEIRARYKPAEEQLEGAINAIRAQMSSYQTQATRIAEVAANKIAGRVGEGRGKLSAETAVRKLGEIDTPLTQVAVNSGSVEFRAQQKLKITDRKALMDYLLEPRLQHLVELDETALLKWLKDGNTIVGAEVEEVQVPVNHR